MIIAEVYNRKGLLIKRFVLTGNGNVVCELVC